MTGHLAVAAAALFCGGGLLWQSLTCSPTSDELNHLAAAVATVQTGDPAHYRVNPPLHKLVSGVVVH